MRWNLRIWLVICILLLLFLQVAQGAKVGRGLGGGDSGGDDVSTKKTLTDSDYNNPDAYTDNKIFDNPKFKNKMVPPNYIDRIPPSKVKLGEVKDPSKLTNLQVLANPSQWPDIDQSKLDPAVRNAVFGEATPHENIETEAAPGTTITPTDDGYHINQLQSFQSDTISFDDAKDITISNDGCWNIKEANIIDFFGITNTKVIDFDGCQDRLYQISKAESVRAGCFDARNVRDATIEINNNLILKTIPVVSFPIFYGFRNRMEYTSIDPTNELIFDPGACTEPFYQVKGVNLTIQTDTATEHINADGGATIIFDRDLGVECINFEPIGSYTNSPNRLESAFGLKAMLSKHKVCVRKRDTQSFPADCTQCTTVDLVDNRIKINGEIQYQRLYYNEDLDPINLILPGLNSYYTTHAPMDSLLIFDDEFHIIESLDSNTPLADDSIVISNWLFFKDYRAQRDAFVNPRVTDASLPLIKEFHSQSFPTIEVKNIIYSGNYYFFPRNESKDFFELLLRRVDLNVPPP